MILVPYPLHCESFSHGRTHAAKHPYINKNNNASGSTSTTPQTATRSHEQTSALQQNRTNSSKAYTTKALTLLLCSTGGSGALPPQRYPRQLQNLPGLQPIPRHRSKHRHHHVPGQLGGAGPPGTQPEEALPGSPPAGDTAVELGVVVTLVDFLDLCRCGCFCATWCSLRRGGGGAWSIIWAKGCLGAAAAVVGVAVGGGLGDCRRMRSGERSYPCGSVGKQRWYSSAKKTNK